MTCRVRLVLAIHNHQPIGNFDGVFEAAFQDSYSPFLEIIKEYPEIPISLHTSGSLLEWLVKHHPEYIDEVRMLVERGQVEIIGGPFYEPILACIPRRDRVGQISAYSRYLEQIFGARVRGMWVPERVWEQSFTDDILSSGIEYTILDDYHFRCSGLSEDELHGYFLTEDEGKLLKVFPGSEKLRYTIPFADPQETIDYLGSIADRFSNPVVTFGDDGEKFGTWPGTKDHVYRDGWLRRMLDALKQNADWLKVCTLSEAVDHVAPVGKVYLSDASYREMTEWALPTQAQKKYQELKHSKEDEPDWSDLQQFMRGGFWRNFRVKYPESNEMYSRMLQVSRRLETAAAHSDASSHRERLAAARTALYRAQCNCPYWHGAFGGLYLPHLRNAIFEQLITADNILDSIQQPSTRWVEISADDFDLDARKEIRISGDRLIAYLNPAQGGHLYELDVRNTGLNLLSTLNRRPEPYHDTVREIGQRQDNGDESVASIHDMVHFKQPDLDKKLDYDNWPRKSLVDHFLQPGLQLETFQQGGGDVGDFVTGVYESRLRRSNSRVETVMSRTGHVGPYEVQVGKTVSLDVESGGTLLIQYVLENLPSGMPIHFGVEFNFAGMAAGASDRYFYDASGQQLGQLESVNNLENIERIGLVDEWLGVDVSLNTSQPGGVWTFPIQTISQSEGGFELVHQSSMVMPHWEFTVPESGRWEVEFELAIDTSAAQAKKLREATSTAAK